MNEAIKNIFQESINVKEATLTANLERIKQAVEAVKKCFQNNGKVLVFGNGGSAADSQHIAAEFIGRFQAERRALPAIALTTDTSILTAVGNDYSFDRIFARQVEGLGQKGDVAVGISTSGNSTNVIEALSVAKKQGLVTVCLSGNGGGKVAQASDIPIVVESKTTARIQESHILIAHTICELVEKDFVA